MKNIIARNLVILAAVAMVAASCGPKTVKAEFGKFVPLQDGVILPIAKGNDMKHVDYSIRLTFEEDGVYLRSPEMLATSYISMAYDYIDEEGNQKGRDMNENDLDFMDKIGGEYVYYLPYGWFPSKRIAENVFQLGVYYAPASASIPIKEVKGPDGIVQYTYPDYSGYSFMFNKEEFHEYFKAFIERLQ